MTERAIELDAPPPGAGFSTRTTRVRDDEQSAADMTTWIWVSLTTDAARGTLSTNTVESGINPEPVMVMVNAESPT